MLPVNVLVPDVAFMFTVPVPLVNVPVFTQLPPIFIVLAPVVNVPALATLPVIVTVFAPQLVVAFRSLVKLPDIVIPAPSVNGFVVLLFWK